LYNFFLQKTIIFQQKTEENTKKWAQNIHLVIFFAKNQLFLKTYIKKSTIFKQEQRQKIWL
jgi:hypothetical protein